METGRNGLTRVAVLGALAEFHQEPIPFDMLALTELVARINPDLLCLDMTPEQWEEKDFSDLPPEYVEALLPLAHQTDIVVAPIGDGQPLPLLESSGWRGKAIGWLRDRIASIQRTAPSADSMNQGWRHDLANHFYDLMRRLASDGSASAALEHADRLSNNILSIARHDPGARVLVVLNIQHCHIVRARLRQFEELEVITHVDL